MEFDKKTGKEIKNDPNKDIIASIYDEEGNLFLVKRDKKVYQKREDDKLEEITDKKRILEVFKLFEPGKTDVVIEKEERE